MYKLYLIVRLSVIYYLFDVFNNKYIWILSYCKHSYTLQKYILFSVLIFFIVNFKINKFNIKETTVIFKVDFDAG